EPVPEDLREAARELHARLEADLATARKDRRLLAALLDARNPPEAPARRALPGGRVEQLLSPDVDEQFARAFLDYGLDIGATTTREAAARLRGRPAEVVREVVAALDEWATERRRLRLPAAQTRRLAALAEALDADPDHRELRALLARDRLREE